MKNSSLGYYIIASALVWGAVIVGCSLRLKGTSCYDQISSILIGGSAIHIVIIWPLVGKLTRNIKNEKAGISETGI